MMNAPLVNNTTSSQSKDERSKQRTNQNFCACITHTHTSYKIKTIMTMTTTVVFLFPLIVHALYMINACSFSLPCLKPEGARSAVGLCCLVVVPFLFVHSFRNSILHWLPLQWSSLLIIVNVICVLLKLEGLRADYKAKVVIVSRRRELSLWGR